MKMFKQSKRNFVMNDFLKWFPKATNNPPLGRENSKSCVGGNKIKIEKYGER